MDDHTSVVLCNAGEPTISANLIFFENINQRTNFQMQPICSLARPNVKVPNQGNAERTFAVRADWLIKLACNHRLALIG